MADKKNKKLAADFIYLNAFTKFVPGLCIGTYFILPKLIIEKKENRSITMEEFGTNVPRDDIYSKAVRAGKRTYFFDVKSTRSNELYLTITESKRRFNQQTGKFYYEKHKLFLYREDFEKFKNALDESFKAIDELQGEIIKPEDSDKKQDAAQKADDITFEDLDKKGDEEDDETKDDKKGDDDSEDTKDS